MHGKLSFGHYPVYELHEVDIARCYAGMILSNGLLLELKKPFFERCVQDDQSGGAIFHGLLPV